MFDIHLLTISFPLAHHCTSIHCHQMLLYLTIRYCTVYVSVISIWLSFQCSCLHNLVAPLLYRFLTTSPYPHITACKELLTNCNHVVCWRVVFFIIYFDLMICNISFDLMICKGAFDTAIVQAKRRSIRYHMTSYTPVPCSTVPYNTIHSNCKNVIHDWATYTALFTRQTVHITQLTDHITHHTMHSTHTQHICIKVARAL